MKLAIIIAVSIFVNGLISKFFHFPFNAIIMMIGLLALIVIMIIAAIKRTLSPLNLIIGFTSIFWMISLLFILKFWPFTIILISISTLLTVFALVLAFRKRQFKNLLPLGIGMTLALTFYLMPTHTRYYFVSIKWNREIEYDFFSWDKYSWFLYQNGKYEEAIKASNKGLRIAQEANDAYWIDLISEHNTQLKSKNWNKF